MCAQKALVVDDSITDLANIRTLLLDMGWQVITANNGSQALQRAQAERPNIVFLDIVMPEMDGYATCRALASDPATQGVPVVFVSTKHTRADEIWARAQGGKALIGKPFAADQILDALRYAA